MGVAVNFDYTAWTAAYPQFSNVTQTQITGPVLSLAEVYCRNDGGGPINDTNLQTQALYLMVAHVAQLMFGSTTQPLSPLVGRVDSATQGSVSVSVEFPDSNPNAAWFNQTPYGAMFFQLIKAVTRGRYFAKTTPLARPWIYGGGRPY